VGLVLGCVKVGVGMSVCLYIVCVRLRVVVGGRIEVRSFITVIYHVGSVCVLCAGCVCVCVCVSVFV